jgi:hypothetical protein
MQLLQQQQGARPPSSSRLPTKTATALLFLVHGARAGAAAAEPAACQASQWGAVEAMRAVLVCLRHARPGCAAFCVSIL